MGLHFGRDPSRESRYAVTRDAIVAFERRYGSPANSLLSRLATVQTEHGGLTVSAADAVADEIGLPRAHVRGTVSFFGDLGFGARGRRHVRICEGTACLAATGPGHFAAIRRSLLANDETTVQGVYCLGYCYGGPAALDGESPRAGPNLSSQLLGEDPGADPDIPVRAAVDRPVVLAGIAGGGSAWPVWRAVLADGGGERVLKEVDAARLRGRGGAEFPVAAKWRAAAATRAERRYVIANGDEGDPGSFADRLLMERDPDRILAGLALASLACEATAGFVYVRSEYPRARDAIKDAVYRARAAGHLGRNIGGSDVDFDVEVIEGAGSYVAGEETSLIRSIEGLRGGVRPRPPFPTTEGLFGLPTAVNNVETLVAVPWILAQGGASYAELGVPDQTGTKLVCLNERFARPGAVEVEFGTPVREICEVLGGGVRDGQNLRALQIGGPLGGFLGQEDLDVPLSEPALRRIGIPLGHASLIAFDERIAGAAILRHLWRFAASESCGSCDPCRIGTKRGLELVERDEERPLRSEERQRLEALLDVMATASMCAFGRGVPGSVRSLLRVYAEELVAT